MDRINSLVPGKCGSNFQTVIFKIILQRYVFNHSHKSALWSMPQNPYDDESTLVRVMSWCRQATSHYLNRVAWCHMAPLCLSELAPLPCLTRAVHFVLKYIIYVRGSRVCCSFLVASQHIGSCTEGMCHKMCLPAGHGKCNKLEITCVLHYGVRLDLYSWPQDGPRHPHWTITWRIGSHDSYDVSSPRLVCKDIASTWPLHNIRFSYIFNLRLRVCYS